MRIGIIADDLTGANDTGVQFTRIGLSTTVLLDLNSRPSCDREVVVLDTDSRSSSREEAYQQVHEVCDYIKQQEKVPEIIYKKIDSTLRGNLGVEWDAVYQAFQPDFIVIAPSYPKAGRVLRNGSMWVNGGLLHETALSQDPKNPSTSSSLLELIEEQTSRPYALVTTELLRGDREHLAGRIKELYQKDIPYLVFDAETDADLAAIAAIFQDEHYQVIWSGSAGLANALTSYYSGYAINHVHRASASELVIAVVGSVNTASRRQLDVVLRQENVRGLELNAVLALTEEGQQLELERITYAAQQALLDERKHVVLYSSAGPETMKSARSRGIQLGMAANQVSDIIGKSLGAIAAQVVRDSGVSNLVLTGGDTARQVCLHLGAGAIELITEIEDGVPVGSLSVGREIYVITKAGGFGHDEVLLRAMRTLTGGESLSNQ